LLICFVFRLFSVVVVARHHYFLLIFRKRINKWRDLPS